jgi:putative sigma-54 modulation protein
LDVSITTRHFEIARELRDFIEARVRAGVGKYFTRAVEANVILVMEKHRYIGEVDIKIRGTSFHACDETHDVHGTIDRLMGKLETQMRRHKEKKKSRNRGKGDFAEQDTYECGQ